jgi:hypothetical protein
VNETTLEAAVRRLTDRADILDCLHRYARGMDRHDRELVRSAYHDDALDEHGGFVGPVEPFIEWAMQYHASQIRHQHIITNVSFDIDGDTAHTEAYYLFVGVEADAQAPLTVVGGRYVDRFERRAGRWAIAARVTIVDYRTSVPAGLPVEAVAWLETLGIHTAQDRSDTSYQRPLVIERVPADQS